MLFTQIIINPAAGRGRALRVLKRATQILTAAGMKYQVWMTKGPGHATHLARTAAQRGIENVTVIGGDGTVGEVIQGLAGTSTYLSIIPAGTGNDHARSLGIPLIPEKAAPLLWQGRPLYMDVGRERDRSFGSLASIGFPVDVIHHTNRKHQLLHGSLAIFTSVWQTVMKLQCYQVTLTLDNTTLNVETVGIFVLNTPFVGGGLLVSPTADVTDGLLDVVVIGRVGRLELLKTLPGVYKGRHINHPAVSFYRCRSVRVETTTPLPKMFDGDLMGYTPLEAFVEPQALRVIVPLDFSAGKQNDGPQAAAEAG